MMRRTENGCVTERVADGSVRPASKPAQSPNRSKPTSPPETPRSTIGSGTKPGDRLRRVEVTCVGEVVDVATGGEFWTMVGALLDPCVGIAVAGLAEPHAKKKAPGSTQQNRVFIFASRLIPLTQVTGSPQIRYVLPLSTPAVGSRSVARS